MDMQKRQFNRRYVIRSSADRTQWRIRGARSRKPYGVLWATSESEAVSRALHKLELSQGVPRGTYKASQLTAERVDRGIVSGQILTTHEGGAL